MSFIGDCQNLRDSFELHNATSMEKENETWSFAQVTLLEEQMPINESHSATRGYDAAVCKVSSSRDVRLFHWGHGSCPVLKINAKPAGIIDDRSAEVKWGRVYGAVPNTTLTLTMIWAFKIFASIHLHSPHFLQSTYSATWTFCFSIDLVFWVVSYT